MQLKSKTNLFIILGAVALGIVSFVALAHNLRPKGSSASPAPSISFLETDDAKVIVHVKSDKQNADEQFVYCLSETNDSSTCDWVNADEFTVEQEGDYYFFVKSLASEKISEPRLWTYQIVDHSQSRM